MVLSLRITAGSRSGDTAFAWSTASNCTSSAARRSGGSEARRPHQQHVHKRAASPEFGDLRERVVAQIESGQIAQLLN